MSTTDFSLLLPDQSLAEEANSLRKILWSRLTLRCADPACPKQGRFWSYWVNQSAGAHFEARWYCSRPCLESGLALRVHALLPTFQVEKPRSYRVPIGLLLIHRGVISPGQLREALRSQREAGSGRLGDWLCRTARITVAQLTAALGQQWGCPVFPLETQAALLPWTDLIPLPLLESAAAVPAYASSDGRVLHLVFGERVDHTLLYAAEQMLQCRTFPCVAPPAAVKAHLEQFRKLTSGNHTTFDTVRESSEIVLTICNYAVELCADRIAMVRAGSYIWVRFFRSGSVRDLLFRILPEKQPVFSERSSAGTKDLPLRADGRKAGVSDAPPQL